ncbi:TetR family transcriptional regulator putative [Paenibacillus terrae HPL-003]|uniref:TetR family transcriptional regulator putative n=1 Tax=Paenibacillus terrae (strain HPL-003) TaxID=985665 RepID=G7VTK0_PAETH|nr:TetR/AcrR family transcriptional regulator [Paenibacillus terrae]AET56883.1 TetR family transcriptional regulator putative [Paenibacillus terrae HPL-003]
MNVSTDLRVVRSRKLIEQALMDILHNQGIKGLTVKNLSQKAGINRGTFYLHYKDIYDLIEQSEWMRGLLEIFEPIQLGHLFKHSDERSPFPAFAEAFRYLQHHSSFFKAIFHSSVPIEFRERLQYLVGTRMYESLKQDHPQSSWSDQPAGYIIAYLGTGQFGLIQHWFVTGRTLPPEEIALMLTRFIRRSPCLSPHFSGS